MGKHIFLLDPGHGGLINFVPQTEGKRSPKWDDCTILYEGEFTRDIVALILQWAPLFDVQCLNLVEEKEDISLKERVRRANGIMRYEHHNCIYISIHANAGGGSGIEVFTTPGMTSSDAIATVFLKKLNAIFPAVRMRTDLSDGDPDKEANFFVLRKTAMPAILTENFFMDNEIECKEILMKKSGRHKIALAHIAAMVEIDKEA